MKIKLSINCKVGSYIYEEYGSELAVMWKRVYRDLLIHGIRYIKNNCIGDFYTISVRVKASNIDGSFTIEVPMGEDLWMSLIDKGWNNMTMAMLSDLSRRTKVLTKNK